MQINIIGPDDPALAAAFKNISIHPEWNAKLQVFPWAEYRDVLMDTLLAEQTPHQAVFVPGHVWIPELAEKGFLAELDPLISGLPEETWSRYQGDDIIQAVQDESRYLDQQYMIPYFNDGQILFYRKDLLNLGPTDTPQEISPLDLVSLAQKTHNPPDIYGIALKAHPSEILFDWLPHLFAAGGKIADDSLKPAFLSEAGIFALRNYCQLRNFAPQDTHTFGNEEIAEILKTGKAALVTTWGGQAAPILLDKNNLFREVYKTAVFPHPCGATWGVSIPANQPLDSQGKALEIILALLGPEQDLDVLVAAGSPVRRRSYFENTTNKYFWLKAQYAILGRFKFLPKDPRISVYFGPLTEAVMNAFLGDKTPEDSLSEAESVILESLGL
jgi:multiple sugar transport system substrate-binding protein